MKSKKFISTAKDVINLEIKALQQLKKNINNSFNQAVLQITKCQSKVILCGVGKSGLIASKIAATLASVGTPSFNLSASEASHGDLGMISKKDILILISNSGETSELKNIIQFANRNKVLLIGIVSKKDSILYKASDIKLLIPAVKEAGGIVPTASTTTQLALGDALAIAVMQNKKFGKIDIFINNAGMAGTNTTVAKYPIDEWNKVINLNLNSVFYCCKAVVPFMEKNNYGRIVNIASIAGKEGNPNASAYSTSKAGVIGLTKSLGKELAQKNIAVNCVTPAAAKTRIFDQMTEEHINYMLSKIPRNKFAKVEELASLVTWLASEENSFSTAAVFDLSGGRATY